MRILYVFSLFLFSFQLSAQTIYVNAAATGAGTGQSWTDAYTSLADALTAATNSESIWVAAGTYQPVPTGTEPREATFYLNSGVKIYGGFSGNEASLSERDISANPTILDGDLNNNDVLNDFENLRDDNVYHVVAAADGGATTHVIDGFTIQGGQTLLGTDDLDFNRRGGGIVSTVPVEVRNCIFKENYASSGASIAILGVGGSGTIVEDCLFESNGSTSQSAGIFFRELAGGVVQRCIFQNNVQITRGCLYPIDCSNILIDSCQFLNNDAGPNNFGGAFYSWESSWEMSNCIFKGNEARNAAAVYINGTEMMDFGRITNSIFEENNNLGYGGTVYNSVGNLEMVDCKFSMNTAASTGAAVYNRGGAVATFKNVEFGGGSASFGAGTANYGDGTMCTYDNCQFVSNSGATSGGAISVGFKASVTVKNSSFESNIARWGGAIYVQNDTSALSLENCNFIANSVENYGGAINIGAGASVLLSECFFEGNSANYGGAFACSEDSIISPDVTILNSIFNLNIANIQGAGLNVNNGKVNLSNCLFSENINSGVGAGGAISNNGSGVLTSEINAKNCTFFGNLASIGAGIANWEADTITASTVFYSMNCIFDNLGSNYEIESGSPDAFSSGGNLSTDATFASIFTNTKDLNETPAGFVDPYSADYHLAAGSACIDGGIANGAPPTDIYGNPRVGDPDKGCYESTFVGINGLIPATRMDVFPNPTTDFIRISMENDFIGEGQFSIISLDGKVLISKSVFKSGNSFTVEESMQDVPQGNYKAYLTLGSNRYIGMVSVIR